MNILNKVTWQSMWKNKSRTIVTIIGVFLSATMFTAVATLGYSLWSYLVNVEVHGSGDYFLRYDYTSQAHLEALRQDDRISELGDLKILGFTSFELETQRDTTIGETCLVAAGDDAFYDMVTVVLEEGRLPRTSDELVITRNIYHYLKDNGLPCEIGQTVTLSVTPENLGVCEIEIPEEGEAFTKTYTIVGISETFTRLNDFTLYLSHLFTYADGNEGDGVWHRAYLKTHSPADARDMGWETPEGVTAITNDNLLALYGSTSYYNYNAMIVSLCAVLMAIIMLGSISLIYNAFSISVSERTKQFGLLSSIGATRKQIRHSVLFEALVLSAAGIPIGIACGYGGIALTLHLLEGALDTLFDTASAGITLHAVPSALAFAAAGAVALVTVLLSAWIPSRRATKVTPLNAIRQTQDYQIPKRGVKAGGLTAKIWGLPGVMAKKYYSVSKRKYRATIISLAISIILFVSAFTVGQSLRIFANQNTNTNNFDMLLYYVTPEQIEEVRGLESVDDTALWISRSYVTNIPQGDQSGDYWQDSQRIAEHRDVSMTAKRLRIFYLEDEVLLDYLEQQDIDPEPYFDGTCPTALVCKSRTVDYVYDPKMDIQNKVIYISDVFAPGVEEVTLYPTDCPAEVRDYIYAKIGDSISDLSLEGGVFYSFYYTSMDGNTMSISEERIVVQVIREVAEDGTVTFSYYLYDPETQTHESSPIHVQTLSGYLPTFKLGESIDELPYGIESSSMSDESTVKIILPLSAAGDRQEDYHYLSLSVNDRNAFLEYLNSSPEGYTYTDHRINEIQYRNLSLMIDVFCYGFIILISLICVANVFNTISTNIALRRRDFGMLRSVGLKTGELYRMMNFECLIYGGKALLWGLPVATALSYGIQWIFRDTFSGKLAPPWEAIAIVTICVFVVVFSSMFYAVTKLRKDNPIDAIRMENT